ncbi:MAG TPA: FkbM family methyltransferase [Actinomycetota bacterium]|nr:FkbM family methyltransferase [Actinomycetota bacterium]
MGDDGRVRRRQAWYGLKAPVKRVLSWRLPHLALREVTRVAPGIAATGRLPAPARLREVEGRVGDVRFVLLNPARCEIAKELYWGDGRRPRLQDALALEVFAALARRADVVLDVGAYTGVFTLVAAAANPKASVHAFEIVPEVFKALVDNCVRNDLVHRVSLHLEGIGEPGGAIRVATGAGGSALPSFYSSRMTFDRGPVVRFVGLDQLLDHLPAGRTLMKVDVEGTEEAVFRHGQRFLAERRPDVLCEVLAGVADAERLGALLAPHGYRWYLVREQELLPRLRIEPHARFRDWLFSMETAEGLRALGLPLAEADPA